jgi:hypothetical protein
MTLNTSVPFPVSALTVGGTVKIWDWNNNSVVIIIIVKIKIKEDNTLFTIPSFPSNSIIVQLKF